MNQFTIINYPYIYLVFISLHLLLGQGLTGFLYWLRFKKSSVIYYQKKSHNPHHMISQWLILPVLFWFVSIIFFAFSNEFRQSIFGWPFIALNPLYGWVLALIGLFGMVVCQYQMGEAFRVGQEPEQEQSQHRLNTQGCFRFSRNPIYFFSILYLFGVSLWILIWLTWVCLITIVLLIHLLVLEEEKFLTKRFGKDYLDYKKRVWRYLGVAKDKHFKSRDKCK